MAGIVARDRGPVTGLKGVWRTVAAKPKTVIVCSLNPGAKNQSVARLTVAACRMETRASRAHKNIACNQVHVKNADCVRQALIVA